MALSPPYWDNNVFKLDLDSTGSETRLKLCLKNLEDNFSASIGDSFEGPGSTHWELIIERVLLTLVWSNDGEIYLCSPDKSDKKFETVLTKISKNWSFQR